MAQWLDRIKFGNGKDGSPTTPIAGHGTCSGSAGSTTLSITDAHAIWQTVAGDVVLIHQSQGTGAGQWEINVATDTLGSGNHTMAYPLTYTYGTGAQIMRVAQFTGGTLSATLTPTSAWNGSWGGIIALMSNGDLTVSGTIDVSGNGFRGCPRPPLTVGSGEAGYSGGYGENTSSIYGGGNIRDGDDTAPVANGGGGSAGNSNPRVLNDASGGGGNGTAGGTGQGGDGGVGGAAAGNAALTSMVFGGGSGAVGGFGESHGADGVNGAGIVLIISKGLTISGSITLNGQNGVNGESGYTGGTGSGAGGSCLIKCQSGVLGTNKIIANGGTPSTQRSSSGGAGGVGRIHIDYYSGYTGTTTPTIDAAQDTNLKSTVYTSMI